MAERIGANFPKEYWDSIIESMHEQKSINITEQDKMIMRWLYEQ